ncbi:hypothetical protein [Streptomyces atratus]|uniref:hypothetical protein n=1 Tax=Streptomyces atratus TaxID=1893 RepID=UPI00340B21B2
MDIWLPAVFGLVGTLLGAFVSGAAAYFVQRHQAQAALDLRRTETEAAAIERLEKGLWEIRQYAQKAPDANVKHWSEDQRAKWGRPIDELTGPLSIAARGIRDSAVRARLVDVLAMVDDSSTMTRHAHPVRYIRPLVEHALDCLGALRRGEGAPPPDEAFTQLKELREAQYVSSIA